MPVPNYKIRPYHIFLLSSFAFAQPLYDLLGRAPEYLAIRRTSPVELGLLVLFLSLIFPLSLVGLHQLIRKLNIKLADLFGGILLMLMFGLTILPALHNIYPRWPKTEIGLALGLGALFVWLCANKNGVQIFLKYLSPACLIFPVLFLCNSNIYKFILPPKIEVKQTKLSGPLPSIFVIVFDEFPLTTLLDGPNSINSARFPNFADFTKTATLYLNATSINGWTEHAVPAILTGNYPDTKYVQVPATIDHPQNLFTLLAPHYRLKVFEQVTHLCPDELCRETLPLESSVERLKNFGLDLSLMYAHRVSPTRFRKFLPTLDGEWGNFLQRRANSAPRPKGLVTREQWADDDFLLEQFTNSVDFSSQPTLHFLHFTFPHVPYRHYPSGKTYVHGLERTNDRDFVGLWSGDHWPAIRAYQRHLLQVAYLDALMGKFFSRLKETGHFDNSLVILTADHGVSFQPGQHSRKLDRKNIADIMRVPLIVKYPGQSVGEVSLRRAETIDVLPTILDSVGYRGYQSDGSSLRATEDRQVQTFYEFEYRTHTARTFEQVPNNQLTLEKQKRLFGQSLEDIYRVGPRPDLTGKKPKEISDLIELNFKLERPGKYAAVKSESNSLPGLIVGSTRFPKNQCRVMPILVSVNGRIEASAWTERCHDGKALFSVLTPESAWVSGENQVQIFGLAEKAPVN